MANSQTLHGPEHVRRYQDTNGEVGHKWNDTQTLILTTTGRKTGEKRDNALIYATYGDAYVVIASKGGAPQHPAWYINLQADPSAEIQVGADVFAVTGRTVTGEERHELWRLMTNEWPAYDDYQTKTDREIPVVVLDRV